MLEYIENRRGGAASAAVRPATRAALIEALADERRAKAVYAAVLARFGDRRPFSNVLPAEGRHEARLLAHFAEFGIDAPADAWATTDVEVPSTFREACERAASAERENVAMYDRLLASLEEPAVRATMEVLRDASLSRHLPAFERHATRRGGPQ